MQRKGAIDSFTPLSGLDLLSFHDGATPWQGGSPNWRVAFEPGDRAHFRNMIQWAGFAGLGSVIDIGCGFGRVAPFLAEVNDLVLGIDQNAGGVQIARSLAALFELPNARFETASALELPVEDASFDGVWSHAALNYMPRGESLAEAHRVLRDTGRLFIGKYNSIGIVLRKYLMGLRELGVDSQLTRWARRALSQGPLLDGRANWGSAASMGEVLAGNGFKLLDDPPLRVYPETSLPDRDLFEDHEALLERLETDPDFVQDLQERRDEVLDNLAGDLDLVAVKV